MQESSRDLCRSPTRSFKINCTKVTKPSHNPPKTWLLNKQIILRHISHGYLTVLVPKNTGADIRDPTNTKKTAYISDILRVLTSRVNELPDCLAITT